MRTWIQCLCGQSLGCLNCPGQFPEATVTLFSLHVCAELIFELLTSDFQHTLAVSLPWGDSRVLTQCSFCYIWMMSKGLWVSSLLKHKEKSQNTHAHRASKKRTDHAARPRGTKQNLASPINECIPSGLSLLVTVS